MKKLLQLLFIGCFVISCSRSPESVGSVIKIDIYEAIANPEAYELIRETENDYVLKTVDTSLKNINILDNDKYHPLTSKLFIYNKTGEYHMDTISLREGPCGFCAFGNFTGSNTKSVDLILRNSEKISGKFDWLWSPIVELCGEVYFLSILSKNNLRINDSDIKEMIVEDYSPKKLMSYPMFNYDKSQVDKKVLSIKWNDKTKHKIDSLYGNKKSVVCVVTINNLAYISGELDTLNSGVTVRDANLTDGLLDSLDGYFPKK